jgi:hypothetical protein
VCSASLRRVGWSDPLDHEPVKAPRNTLVAPKERSAKVQEGKETRKGTTNLESIPLLPCQLRHRTLRCQIPIQYRQMPRALDRVREAPHHILPVKRQLSHIFQVLREGFTRDRELRPVDEVRVREEVFEDGRDPTDGVDIGHVVFPRGSTEVREWAGSCEMRGTYLRSAR